MAHPSKDKVLKNFEKYFPDGDVTCLELQQVILDLNGNLDSAAVVEMFCAAEPNGVVKLENFVSWLFDEKCGSIEEENGQSERALELRAMTLERLIGFYKRHCRWIDGEQREPNNVRMMSKTTEEVVLHLIKPATCASACSFAELGPPSKVDFFASHWWGDEFKYLSQALACFSKNVEQPDPAFWIDIFGINHHSVSAVGDGDSGSFRAAVQASSCQGAVMVLNAEATPASRIWCSFDVLCCSAPNLCLDLATKNGCPTRCVLADMSNKEKEAMMADVVMLRQQLMQAYAEDASQNPNTSVLEKLKEVDAKLEALVIA